MSAITSSTLATAASNLRAVRTALLAISDDYGDTITASRTALELLPRCWDGPIPDDCEAQLAEYVDSVAPLIDGVDGACEILSDWAAEADELSGDLASAESWLGSTNEAIALYGEEGALVSDRNSAQWRLADLRTDWSVTCSRRCRSLDATITAVQDCAATTFSPPAECAEPTSATNVAALAGWAIANGMKPSDVGLPAADVRRALEEVAGTDDRAAIFAELEPDLALAYWQSLPADAQQELIEEAPVTVVVYVLAAGGVLTVAQLEQLDLDDLDLEAGDGTDTAAAGALEALLAHPYAFLGLAALETTNDGQHITEADGDLSDSDQDDGLDPRRIEELIRQGVAEFDLDLSDAEIAALVSLTVGANALGLAADDDTALREEVARAHAAPPELTEDELVQMEADVFDALANMDGVGICAEASGSLGPRAGEAGTCFISTDDDFGQIAWYGFGVAGTGGGASAGAGTILTNAENVNQLGGPAVCFTGGGGAGGGGTGTVCGGVVEVDGGYRFNGIVTVQGNVTATTPGASVTVSAVDTRVVWRNGVVNAVVRAPIEAVIDSDSAPWNWGEGIQRIGRAFRSAR